MDMETAQDRYDRNAPRYEMTQPPKPSKNIASDEDAKRYAEMVRRRKKEYDDKFGKMLLKADIESGYEDDVFYWMFFWMSDNVRENVKSAFRDYSQLKPTFDDSNKIRLIDLLDPDFGKGIYSYPQLKTTGDGQYDIDSIKAAYGIMFLKEIYNKKIEQKGFAEVLEDVSFIPILKENKTSFDSMDKIDFEPEGQTNKFRSSDKRPPKKVAKPTGRKKKVDGKMVEVMDNVPERLTQQEREIITNLILPARNRYSRQEGRA